METNLLPFYLTKSRVRSELLAVFFLNKEQSFYLRELERRLGCSPGVLARELKAFSTDGLLEKESRGKEIYYKINPKHPFFQEIRGIIEKTAGVPVQLRKGLKKIKEIEEAHIYGSFVKGGMRADSDIDLLLVGKETEAVLRLLHRLEQVFGRELNATTYSRSEFEKKRNDQSNFLYTVMKSSTIQIKP